MAKRRLLLLSFALLLAGAATAPLTAPSTRPATVPATTRATTSALTAASAPAARTTNDGVYNEEQLARGRRAYLTSCTRCHGDTLLGNDDAPALVGVEFMDKWVNKPLGDLVEYCRVQMPSDGPGKLTRKEITDITVFLINANGAPVGKAELSSELADLNRVQLQVKK